jgi:transcription initiation factor TFIIIB Brf1 subunit/transcription initiation factor TFIIB
MAYLSYPHVTFCRNCNRSIEQDEIDVHDYEQVHMACGLVLSNASDCMDARPAPDYDDDNRDTHVHFAPVTTLGTVTRIGHGRGSYKLARLNHMSCKTDRFADNRHICDALNAHLHLADPHLRTAHEMFSCVERSGGTVPKHNRKATFAAVIYFALQMQGHTVQRTLIEIQKIYSDERLSHEPASMMGFVDGVRDKLMQSDAFGAAMRNALPTHAYGMMRRVLQALHINNVQKIVACENVLQTLENDAVGQSVNSGTQVGAVIWFVKLSQGGENFNVTLKSVADAVDCQETTIKKHWKAITEHLRQTR